MRNIFGLLSEFGKRATDGKPTLSRIGAIGITAVELALFCFQFCDKGRDPLDGELIGHRENHILVVHDLFVELIAGLTHSEVPFRSYPAGLLLNKTKVPQFGSR